MKDVTTDEPPIHVMDTMILERDKGDLVQHDVVQSTGSGRSANQSGISYKVSIYALSDTRSRWKYVSWRADLDQLFRSKGVEEDADAKRNLTLSVLKGTPRDTFQDAIDDIGCDTMEKFDLCMMEVTKLFFSIDSLDAQVEYIRQIRKPEEMDMQQFVSASRNLIKRCKYMVVDPDQVVPVISNAEHIRLVHNGCPEGWRKTLQKSNSKLNDMSMEQLIAYFEPMDATKRRYRARLQGYEEGRSKQSRRLQNSRQGGAKEVSLDDKKKKYYCKNHGKGNHDTANCYQERQSGKRKHSKEKEERKGGRPHKKHQHALKMKAKEKKEKKKAHEDEKKNRVRYESSDSGNTYDSDDSSSSGCSESSYESK